ncbi:hypothetical protein SAMN05445504_2360 [Burkholderia sp. CF099]|nr:hypothetical protein SAMN05445504_2360 [Burkholderia sp. CF099]
MQKFIDTATQQLWAFDDDVKASKENGSYMFSDAHGDPLQVPSTLQPYTPTVEETAADEAAAARAALVAQASSAFAAGIRLSSTGTPELDGIYSCDAVSQADIVAIEASLITGKVFPSGATTLDYPDASGKPHSFSPSTFLDFASAVRTYVYALKALLGGASDTLPNPEVTIP